MTRFKLQSRDGRTSYERRFGKRERQGLMEFGEAVRYIPFGQSVHDDRERRIEQAEAKHENCLYPGTERDINEYRIGGEHCVVKALAVKRLVASEQWSAQMVNDLVGVPRDPRGSKAAIGQATADTASMSCALRLLFN